MRSSYTSLGVCLVFYLWMQENPDVLLAGASILELFVYINFITVVLYPDGLYATDLYTKNWFLGYKNIQIRTILPILSLSMIYSYRKKGHFSFRVWILIFVSMVTFLMVGSSTSLVGFTVFIAVVVLFCHRGTLPRFFTLRNCVLVSVVAFIAIIFFSVQNSFPYLFEVILGKDLTFNARVPIWQQTVQFIQERPLIGYGYMSGENYVFLYALSRVYTHPHNYFMYVAMSGGIVLLVTLICGYIRANAKLKSVTSTMHGKLILCCLFAFLIMGLDESLTSTVLLYPMLVMAMESDKFVGDVIEKQESVVKVRQRNGRLSLSGSSTHF